MAISQPGLIVGAVAGCVVLVLGGIMFPIMDTIIHDEVAKNVILYKNTTVGYQNWANLPGGLYIKFYFFTLMNKAEVMAGGKPALVETGPYSYKQFKPKYNITYNHEKGTVNYTSMPTYVFDPETSIGDPQDKIITINVPLMAVAEQLKYVNPVLQELVLKYLANLENEDIFIERTVEDILWGYEDPLLKLIHDFKPDLVPDSHFGFMYNRNNTMGKLYEIFSGETDVMQIGNIVGFNGMDHLEWWTTPEANAINGSDGTYNHPFWSKDGEAYLFSSDVCRSIKMTFERDTKIRGIPTWKFSVPEYALMNGMDYPPNAGFCIPDMDHCLPNGLLNISKCQGGAPAIMSLPHFLFVDKKVQDQVYGLHPDAEKHNAYINVEPYTGASLEGALRMQFNIWMENFTAIDQMKNLPTLPFPVMWVNQIGTVSADAAVTIKNQLIKPIMIANIVKWSLVALGAFMFVIFVAVYFKRMSTVKSRSNSYDSKNSSVNANNEHTSAPPLNETKPLLS